MLLITAILAIISAALLIALYSRRDRAARPLPPHRADEFEPPPNARPLFAPYEELSDDAADESDRS